MTMTLGHCRPWSLGAAVALHVVAIAWPALWAYFHLMPAQRVEVFLVQSQAQVAAPKLTQSSSQKSVRAAPKEAPPVAPPKDTGMTTPVAKKSETPEEAEVNALNSAAGAPPAELPRFDPAYLNNQPPLYPAQSRRLGEQGKVLLRVYVLPNGSAREVVVSRSSGSERLDAAARRAVQNWKFIPAQLAGSVVSAWVLVPIKFSLEG
jgi:protein TonB